MCDVRLSCVMDMCVQLRFKIFRNIGQAFVRLGQFQDAIQSFETVMGGTIAFPLFESNSRVLNPRKKKPRVSN